MSRAATGIYGGVGANQRRERRRAQLIEAALELLGTDGWQACTVRAICARARLTPRYFYESFAERDAILIAVFDEITDELTQRVVASVTPPPGDARTTARAAISAGVYVLTDDPRKGRVLFSEALGSEILAARRRETLRGFAALVAAQGRSFYGIAEPADRRVDLGSMMLVGGLAEAFAAWLDGDVRSTREQLIDDCAELFVATGEAAVGLIRAATTPPRD